MLQGQWAASANKGRKGRVGRQEGQMSTRTREGLDSTARSGGRRKHVSLLSLQHLGEVCVHRMNKNKFIKVINWKSNLPPSRNYGGNFQQHCFSTFIDQRNWGVWGGQGTRVRTNKKKIHRPSRIPVTSSYLAEKLCCEHLSTHADCVRTQP